MTGQVSTQPMVMTTSASYRVICEWFRNSAERSRPSAPRLSSPHDEIDRRLQALLMQLASVGSGSKRLLPGHPLVLAAELVAAAMSRLAVGHRLRRGAVLTSMARRGRSPGR